MAYSLTQAATKTGKARSTIFRAIKAGKISAYLDKDGNYRIEKAELLRAYPPDEDDVIARNAQSNKTPLDELPPAMLRILLEKEKEERKKEVARIEAEREKERAQSEARIEDLKAQLTQITALLPPPAKAEDTPPPPKAEDTPPPATRRWWPWK